MLTSVGHQESVYTGSKTALAGFNNSPDDFDVLITDQTMPYLLGSELISAIKDVRPELPMILCTGYTELVDSYSMLQVSYEASLLTKLGQKNYPPS